MKRILLFLATNLAVMIVLSTTASILGVNKFLTNNGLDFTALLGFAAVMGFGGALISLWISKPIAKWSTGAQVIETPKTELDHWLINTIRRQTQAVGIPMPEVAIYEGEPNAFATGATKNSALVAVSTGLLQSMNKKEIEAVLAHEIAHIANGDMVTLTLIQGVVNTFVTFLARVVGYIVDQGLRKNDEEYHGPGIGYTVTVVICDLLFGILASIIVMYFSRRREFHADAGAAKILGTPQPMISALRRLSGIEPGELPKSMAASGITGGASWMEWFSSHPSVEQRIAALEAIQAGVPRFS